MIFFNALGQERLLFNELVNELALGTEVLNRRLTDYMVTVFIFFPFVQRNQYLVHINLVAS